MKNKAVLITIITVLIAALLVGGIVAISNGRHSDGPADNTKPGSEPGSDITVPVVPNGTSEPDETSEESNTPDVPSIPVDSDESDDPDETDPPIETSEVTDPVEVETEPVTDKPEDPGVVIVEPKDPEAEKPVVTGKAEEPVKPVVTDKGEEKKDPEPTGTIVIGGGDPEHEVYDCKTPNHHCDGPETHAYITNLELKGCKYCGSHSCPSFYAVDRWGNTCYTPSECPMYNAHNDPRHYCQTCGKKVGDGSNGTCVTFNVDIICPLCGASVKAWECHTCK